LAARRSARERSASQGHRLPEIRRAQISYRRRQVLPVQHVPCIHTQGQVVTVIRIPWPEDRAHAGARTSSESTSTAWPTATMSAASTRASSGGRLLTEAEGFCQPQVERELRGTVQIIDWDARIRCTWLPVVASWICNRPALRRERRAIVV